MYGQVSPELCGLQPCARLLATVPTSPPGKHNRSAAYPLSTSITHDINVVPIPIEYVCSSDCHYCVLHTIRPGSIVHELACRVLPGPDYGLPATEVGWHTRALPTHPRARLLIDALQAQLRVLRQHTPVHKHRGPYLQRYWVIRQEPRGYGACTCNLDCSMSAA